MSVWSAAQSFGYAGRAEFIASSAAGDVLVDFTTVSATRPDFSSRQLLIASVVQLELLRQAGIRCGRSTVDARIVLIAETVHINAADQLTRLRRPGAPGPTTAASRPPGRRTHTPLT